jgi:flagellar hook assembly protein FlgD
VDSRVTVDLYNIIGQRVRTLVNDNVAAGYHIAEWDGTGNAGQQLASGVYFLQMSAQGVNGKSFNEIRKLMMLK